MRFHLALAALVFTPSAILGQLSLQAPSTFRHAPSTFFTPTIHRNCPVGVTARLAPRGAVVQADSMSAQDHLAYAIVLKALDFASIQQAEIKLVGIAGFQLMPVSTSEVKYVSEHLTVSANTAPSARLETMVYTRRLTGVQWIEVESVTYASGEVWRQKSGGVCRVHPGGMLEVSDK